MKTIYLFLDVDGVLNNQKIIQETKKMQAIDEQNLINLNKLIKIIKKRIIVQLSLIHHGNLSMKI